MTFLNMSASKVLKEVSFFSRLMFVAFLITFLFSSRFLFFAIELIARLLKMFGRRTMLVRTMLITFIMHIRFIASTVRFIAMLLILTSVLVSTVMFVRCELRESRRLTTTLCHGASR